MNKCLLHVGGGPRECSVTGACKDSLIKMPTDFPSFQLPESHSVGIQCFGCKTAEWKCRNAVSCALGAFLKAAPGGLQHLLRQKAGLTPAQCGLFLLNQFLPFTNVSLSALPHTPGSWDKSQGRPDLAPGFWLHISLELLPTFAYLTSLALPPVRKVATPLWQRHPHTGPSGSPSGMVGFMLGVEEEAQGVWACLRLSSLLCR